MTPPNQSRRYEIAEAEDEAKMRAITGQNLPAPSVKVPSCRCLNLLTAIPEGNLEAHNCT